MSKLQVLKTSSPYKTKDDSLHFENFKDETKAKICEKCDKFHN